MTSRNENKLLRNVAIIVIAGVLVSIILDIFDIPGTVSGNTVEIKRLESNKMDKVDADSYFNRLEILLSQQIATWSQYMISNEKEKDMILHEIERIQDDIKELNRNYMVTRGEDKDFINSH